MSDIVPQKPCSKCGQSFPATTEYFRKASKEKSGLTSRCKSCLHQGDAKYRADNPEVGKEWREENRDRINAEFKEKYWSDPEYYRAMEREKYAQNPEYKKRKATEYREKYPEKVRATKKVIYIRKRNDPEWVAAEKLRIADYYIHHPEKNQELYRKGKEKYRDQRREWEREDYRKYPAKHRAKHYKRVSRIKQAGGTYTANDLMHIYNEQEGRCAYCGISIYWSVKRDIHVDHIHPLSKGGSNWPDNLALACHSCNESKFNYTLEEWIARRGW